MAKRHSREGGNPERLCLDSHLRVLDLSGPHLRRFISEILWET